MFSLDTSGDYDPSTAPPIDEASIEAFVKKAFSKGSEERNELEGLMSGSEQSQTPNMHQGYMPVQQSATHYPVEVLDTLTGYFDTHAKQLEIEAEKIFSELSQGETEYKRIQEKMESLAGHKNPNIRLKVAQLGLCGNILKYDPVAKIRRQILISTGDYSEFYREREDSLEVIKEMIKQGIDPEFFASHSEYLAHLVGLQYEADLIISQLANQNEEVLYLIVSDFANLIQAQEEGSFKYNQIKKTVETIEFFYQNQLNSKIIKADTEILKENDVKVVSLECQHFFVPRFDSISFSRSSFNFSNFAGGI